MLQQRVPGHSASRRVANLHDCVGQGENLQRRPSECNALLRGNGGNEKLGGRDIVYSTGLLIFIIFAKK